MNFIRIFNSIKLYLLGAVIGGTAGYLYYKLVGCVDGTCAITSNPWKSTLYFAAMGALAFSMFKKSKPAEKKESDA